MTNHSPLFDEVPGNLSLQSFDNKWARTHWTAKPFLKSQKNELN
jgi:hypothetical protein